MRLRDALPLKKRLGYVLAGEEHHAGQLVCNGALAEQAGFSFLFVSDHFHPWGSQQGHGSFLWSVLGALALQTSDIGLVSAVSCPILRMHPSMLAQAASTIQALSGGRFVLGLGTGESLNESITGYWPPFKERLERLQEVIYILRLLWQGQEVTYRGRYFTVSKARLFDAQPAPVAVAASGVRIARFAAQAAEALIGLDINPEVVSAFKTSGGREKPCWTQLSVCWAPSDQEAVSTAHRLWPIVALEGEAFARLANPREVEEACAQVTREDVAAAIVCGPNPESYLKAIRECFACGYQGVALHAIGPDQKGFFEFFKAKLAPELKADLEEQGLDFQETV